MKKKRQEALEWWRSLSYADKKLVAFKHFGTMEFVLISTSSNRIEYMFNKES